MNDKKTSVIGLKKSLWTDGIRGVMDQGACEKSLKESVTCYQVQVQESGACEQ